MAFVRFFIHFFVVAISYLTLGWLVFEALRGDLRLDFGKVWRGGQVESWGQGHRFSTQSRGLWNKELTGLGWNCVYDLNDLKERSTKGAKLLKGSTIWHGVVSIVSPLVIIRFKSNCKWAASFSLFDSRQGASKYNKPFAFYFYFSLDSLDKRLAKKSSHGYKCTLMNMEMSLSALFIQKSGEKEPRLELKVVGTELSTRATSEWRWNNKEWRKLINCIFKECLYYCAFASTEPFSRTRGKQVQGW